MDHVDLDRALGFFRALGEDGRIVLLHLFECPRCRMEVQTELRAPVAAPLSEASGLARRIVGLASKHLDDRERELRRDFQQAGPLYDELLELPPGERDATVDGETRFQTPGVALWLLDAAREAAARHPERSGHLASLALSVAERLGPGWAETSIASGLRARAWCWIGESRRLQGGAGAEDAFLRAVHHLGAEPVTEPERALLCRLLARLRRDQERTDEALALAARAVALPEENQVLREMAEALADQGWLLLEMMEAEAALGSFQAGFALADPRARPRTVLSICHGLALCHVEMGAPRKAEKLLVRARQELAGLLQEPVDQMRLGWIEAEVLERAGELDRAIRGLDFLTKAFIGLGAWYDAALAALHLARCYSDRNLLPQIGWLRNDLSMIWESEKIPAVQAHLLSWALDYAAGQAGAGDLLRRASDHLVAARFNPRLPFHPREEPAAELFWDGLDAGFRLRLCADAKTHPDRASQPGREIPAPDRAWISWSFEECTGVRLVFEETAA